ncbi:MAG: TMEM165/GDT1 family protein [Chloroflexi bacterium]|nr:TMEM165/GDT1 family protein [Chloroflexota bacterium]
MVAFWQSLVLVFLAEMGDKTQLVSLAFATRYGPATVLGGVALATLAVHLVSVAIGQLLGLALPYFWINLIAGLAFLAFGVWTVRGDRLDDDPSKRWVWSSPLLAVTVAFFLAELGDKTMLTTVTVASQHQAFVPVWIGSTLGMVVADGLAIALGIVLGKRLPAGAIRLAAAAIFFGFGLWTLTRALLGGTPG